MSAYHPIASLSANSQDNPHTTFYFDIPILTRTGLDRYVYFLHTWPSGRRRGDKLIEELCVLGLVGIAVLTVLCALGLLLYLATIRCS
jgi:hypothetical protein